MYYIIYTNTNTNILVLRKILHVYLLWKNYITYYIIVLYYNNHIYNILLNIIYHILHKV